MTFSQDGVALSLLDRRQRLDFRNEGLTPPTAEMWEAMRRAACTLEMAFSGADETVRELEATGATLTGQEAGLLVPSATAGTAAALLSWDLRAKRVLMEQRSHLWWMQGFHHAVYGSSIPIGLPGDKFGAISVELLRQEAQRSVYGMHHDVGAICLENTHTVCGGTVLTPHYMQQVATLATTVGARLFVDGARIFDAAVAQDVEVADLTAQADAVVVSLNKGPGAPYGALLCGSAAVIRAARHEADRLGVNQVHKAGIFAAAGLVGLKGVRERLKRNHAMAGRMARALSQLEGLSVDLETVQTNLMRVNVGGTGLAAVPFAERLAAKGLGVRIVEPDCIRFVTHDAIDDSHVEEAISIVNQVITELP